MAIIVEFPGRGVSRYGRKHDELDDRVGEILLFTGVQHERAGGLESSLSTTIGDGVMDAESDGGQNVSKPKSVG